MTNTARLSDQVTVNAAIREYTEADCKEIAEIYNQSITAGGSTMDTDLKSEAQMLQLVRSFHDRETILVLEDDRRIVGWGIIKRYSDRIGYRVCCETSVYLRREELRKGYGSRIKLALVDRCKAMGYHHMVAKILSGNTNSIEYCKKIGYEVVGKQKEVGFVKGRWQDVVIMQLILHDVPPYRPELG